MAYLHFLYVGTSVKNPRAPKFVKETLLQLNSGIDLDLHNDPFLPIDRTSRQNLNRNARADIINEYEPNTY